MTFASFVFLHTMMKTGGRASVSSFAHSSRCCSQSPQRLLSGDVPISKSLPVSDCLSSHPAQPRSASANPVPNVEVARNLATGRVTHRHLWNLHQPRRLATLSRPHSLAPVARRHASVTLWSTAARRVASSSRRARFMQADWMSTRVLALSRQAIRSWQSRDARLYWIPVD
jgi:hypothetical protein